MKRNLRQSIFFALIVLNFIISSCLPNKNYSPESDFQEVAIRSEPGLQEQFVEGEPLVCFDNLNANPTSEFPPIPPTFTLTESWHITSILVMHWNQAQGAEPGEITILDDQYNVYGTWQAEAVSPEPQFPNTFWHVMPDVILEPGTYIIYDSDPATQSYNADSDNMGMARVKGFPLSNQPGSFYANNEGGRFYPLEEMLVKGVVTLPRDSSLSFSELTVLTMTETAPVEGDGTFRTTSMHTPSMPQLAMALNQHGNPVLMGIFGASELDGYGLSVESTARAFVLFDMAVLSLSPEKRAIISAALDNHQSYTKLQEMVAQTIKNDPVDPLLGDNNTELYDLAVWMTADLLNQSGLLPLASGNSGIMPISFMQNNTDNTKYVDVEDDEEFGPQVVLVNKTWAYYKVNISVDGKPWTLAGSPAIYLGRNNLYGTINMEWPPVSYRSMFDPEVGDGLLSFTFTHDKSMTLLDLFMTTASTVLGIGESATSDKGLRFLLAFKSTFADGIRDLMQAFPQHQQMSFGEAVAVYSWAIGFNGGKLLLDVGEAIIKEEISSAVEGGLAKRAFKFILKKAAKPVALAYGSADMAAIIYSYNNAPESVVFNDEQRFGIYPAVTMECKSDVYRYGNGYTIGEEIYFYKYTTNVPKGENLGLYYILEFDDGDNWSGHNNKNEEWSEMTSHIYDNHGDYFVKLSAYVGGATLAAECTVPVTIYRDESEMEITPEVYETSEPKCPVFYSPVYNEDSGIFQCVLLEWPCPPYSEPIMDGATIIGCEEPYSP